MHLQIYNLGSGHGYSVLEMAAAMERASGKKVRNFYNFIGESGIFVDGAPLKFLFEMMKLRKYNIQARPLLQVLEFHWFVTVA